MVRNVMQGEPGLTWQGLPVDIGRPFKVWDRDRDGFGLMVPVTVHETDHNGQETTHRRNVPVESLERRK